MHPYTEADLILFYIAQDDKDLVPEFVLSEGLTCFIKVGAEADHNYQNYILRGLFSYYHCYKILHACLIKNVSRVIDGSVTRCVYVLLSRVSKRSSLL